MGGNRQPDPRTQAQNQVQNQQARFEQQQGPLANEMAYNYGRGAESQYGDYTDIMNQYRGIASGTGTGAGSEDGGGGGGGYSPFLIGYNDPFKSYEGFTEFSNTGGYSGNDIGNLRARGVSPIRAAYANAERELGRQRSLQGGYSPNAFALQGRMAREQGQLAADAVQNVEGGIVNQRNQNRLSGLQGMSGIEGQRLNADLEVGRFNAQQQASAQAANNATRDAISAEGRANQLRALQGMTSLYGTTPGMASTFGNQALSAVGMGANAGQGFMSGQIAANQQPTAYQQTMNNVNQGISTGRNVADLVGTGMYAYDQYRNRRPQVTPRTQPVVGFDPGYGNIPG